MCNLPALSTDFNLVYLLSGLVFLWICVRDATLILVWTRYIVGNLAELMSDWERAMASYEYALRHNPYSINALSHIASLCRGREQFAKVCIILFIFSLCTHSIGQAVDYFKRILAIQENNGETWSALGHCYLMMDNLQEAYHAYQQALYHLPNPKVNTT